MALPCGAHQLVIIAKPHPGRSYCQLATALQTCQCGQSILYPCLNALRVLSNESHRVGILQELAFAAESQAVDADLMLPADQYYQSSGQTDADCRFPYITATLVSSMASCLDQEHSGYRCSLEAPFHAVSNAFGAAGDPLYEDCTGTSPLAVGVIDITDPHKPRYCFLNMNDSCVKCGLRGYHLDGKITIDKSGDLMLWDMAEYTPSPGEVISCRTGLDPNSMSVPARDEEDAEALEMLGAYALIDVATLASCWPSPAWKLPKEPAASSTQVSVHPGQCKRGVKSLRELAHNELLDAVLLGLLDDLKLLEYPMLIRGFPKSFLAACAARADDLATSEHQQTISGLLARLLEGVAHVDLYPFRQLPVGTIREILRSGRLREAKTLNLSGLFDGSPEEIWTTLDILPHQLEVVYLLSLPSVGRVSEHAEIKRTIPHYMGKDYEFWDRVGSKKIIMSASLSTALTSYGSSHRSSNIRWELAYLKYLRELAHGDTMRLRLWPWMWW